MRAVVADPDFDYRQDRVSAINGPYSRSELGLDNLRAPGSVARLRVDDEGRAKRSMVAVVGARTSPASTGQGVAGNDRQRVCGRSFGQRMGERLARVLLNRARQKISPAPPTSANPASSQFMPVGEKLRSRYCGPAAGISRCRRAIRSNCFRRPPSASAPETSINSW